MSGHLLRDSEGKPGAIAAADGQPQIAEERGIIPTGATGHPEIDVMVA